MVVPNKTVWTLHPTRLYETTTLGRCMLLVWTGSPDPTLDNGAQVMSLYIPTTDREYPEGLVLIGRRILETTERETAKAFALVVAEAEIAYRTMTGLVLS